MKMRKTCLLFAGLLTGVAFSETLENGSLKIEFADSENGFGVKSVVNRAAGDVRFVNPDGVPTDRWRVEEYRHCPNFCWPCPDAGKSLADFWELELRDARALGDRTKAVFLDNRSPSRSRNVRREGDGATFVWTGVKLPEGEVDVWAHVGFAADGTSRWTIGADVRSPHYVLHNTRYPMLRHVVRPGEADFLEPRADFGAKLRRKAGYDKRPQAYGVLAYVPMMTAFMIGDAGLYIAAHDGQVNTKTLVVTGDRDVAFSSPEPRGGFEVTVAAFKGDWWQAAGLYRKWAMTAPWCKKGRILDRDDYPRRLCEIPLWFNFHGKAAAASNALTRAKALFPGVTTGLHWHRWQAVSWEIGHYPEYFPEDEGVRDCLKYCQSIGQEPLLYALPRLYSKSLLSFHFAEPYAVMDENGKYCVEQYGRLEDNPPELVQMCPGVGKWQDCVVDYTTRMFDLGARSVFQDQVSSCPAKSCYGAGHDHRPGGGTWFYESVRAICARTHEVARARGGFSMDEGSVDAFNDVVDGHLTITQRTPEDVPFWHAVYNGYTTYIGSPENHDDDNDTFWAMQTRDVLWGQALGWYHTLLMDRPEKVDLVRKLVAFRQANLDCLAYGELLGEVAFSGEVPTRALTMLGRKSFPDWANPNAKLSPTITGKMAGVLGYRYRSGTTGRPCAIMANLMPTEVAVGCSLKAPNDRLVLAPREIRRIELPDTRTYDENGRPVYDLAPFENYAETALTAGRRAELLATLPGRLAAAGKDLDAAAAALKTAFASAPEAVQFERAEKRMVMARRLCDYVRLNLAKVTVSGICQAENGVEGLEKFVAYFAEEIAAWKSYPLAPGVKAKRFNLRDFGAKGDGVADDEPAFRKAFAVIRQLNGAPSVLEIPAGEYLVNAKRIGTNPQPLLRFEKIVNCVLEGAGPETTKIVYGNYDGDGMDFRDWENSALRGVEVYWKESPFVEGEVESVDRTTGSLVLRHHANTLRPNDPRFARIGYANSCMQFDRNREPIRNPVLWYKYKCDDLGNGRYRMYFDPEYGSTKTMPIEPGATLVFPDRSNAISALRATSSRFFTFENVWIRNSRAGAFSLDPSYQSTVVGCRIFPKDPVNCLSTNADGNFTAAGACLMRCEFVNMNDDGVNSHHKGKIFYTSDAATGKYAHDSNWQWEKPGDYVQVISSMDGRYLLNTRVKSVEISKETRQRQLTAFVDPLPANVRTYTSLGIAPYDALTRRKIYLGTMKTDKFPDQFYVPYTWGIGFVCTDNVFRNIRGVAIQIQCPNALVENNRIENVYRGIEFSGLLHYQEGPPPYNVILRGNVFRNVNRGIKSTFMTLNHPPAVTTPMGLLLIESNRVEKASERALVLVNAEDSLVRDNAFTASGGIDVNVCRGIVFSGNTLDGKPVDAALVKPQHSKAVSFR